MPELPEVEVVRRTVWPRIAGRTILDARIHEPRLPQNVEPAALEEKLRGRVFTHCRRRAKYLLFTLSGRAGFVLHLRMTGQLIFVEKGESVGAGGGEHVRMILTLDGGRLELRDARRFATIHWVEGPAFEDLPFLQRLGPEPLDPAFTAERFAGRLAGRRAPIKSVLLNQACVAGLGNIYADEALFRARVHPLRPASALSREEVERLHRAVQEVLREAVHQGGTSIRNYRNGAGEPGTFQTRLQVYGRQGQPCPVCRRPIGVVRLAGRSSSFCEGCQR